MSDDPRRTYRHRKMRETELAGEVYCYRCQQKLAAHIHHPWPIARGGPAFHSENRVPLCVECHRAETLNPTFFMEGT